MMVLYNTCFYGSIRNLKMFNVVVAKGVCLWCLTPLSTMFKLYRGD